MRTHAQVESVTVTRRLPGTIVVRVKERHPVALVDAPGGPPSTIVQVRVMKNCNGTEFLRRSGGSGPWDYLFDVVKVTDPKKLMHARDRWRARWALQEAKTPGTKFPVLKLPGGRIR